MSFFHLLESDEESADGTMSAQQFAWGRVCRRLMLPILLTFSPVMLGLERAWQARRCKRTAEMGSGGTVDFRQRSRALLAAADCFSSDRGFHTSSLVSDERYVSLAKSSIQIPKHPSRVRHAACFKGRTSVTGPKHSRQSLERQ